MEDTNNNDPYAEMREAWRGYRISRKAAVKEMYREQAEIFESVVQEMCKEGLSRNEIAQIVGVCPDCIGQIWRRANDYRPINWNDRTECQQPDDAVYYPEPNGLGFVMTPTQYWRLVQIRALKRQYAGEKMRYRTELVKLERTDTAIQKGDWGQWA